MVSSMDLATCLAAGKITLQAVTLTKTCITIYRKADGVYRWYKYCKPSNKNRYDDCVIIELVPDGSEDGFMLMTCRDEKRHKGKCKNDGKSLFSNTKHEARKFDRDADRDSSGEHGRESKPEEFPRRGCRQEGE